MGNSKPKTTDEGLADINLLCEEMLRRKDTDIAKWLAEAIAPVADELMRLRLENEKLTAAVHRKSEDRH